jgi:hypothetical protein
MMIGLRAAASLPWACWRSARSGCSQASSPLPHSSSFLPFSALDVLSGECYGQQAHAWI